MTPNEKKVLLLIIVLGLAWYMGWLNPIFEALKGGVPPQPQPTTPAPTGAKSYAPVQFIVRAMNGTGVGSAVAEIYTYDAGSLSWNLVTSATADSSGKVLTVTSFWEGTNLKIHVKQGTYDGKKVQDTWIDRSVGSKPADLTYIPLEDVVVIINPSAASNLDIKLFDNAYNAVGTTDATATVLTTNDFNGQLSLVIKETWTGFGGTIEVPKTNQGHTARTLKAFVYAEFNTTSIRWDSTGWFKAKESSSTYSRWAREVDQLIAYDKQPVTISFPFEFDSSGLGASKPFKITVHYINNQTKTDIEAGIAYAGSGNEVGYVYDKSATFYLKTPAS